HLAGRLTDPGLLDAHEVIVDWDAGAPPSVFEVDATMDLAIGDAFTSTVGDGASLRSVDRIAGAGRVRFEVGSPRFASGGVFDINVMVGDDDSGGATASTRARLSGLRVADGVLQIVGSETSDRVTINQQGNG